MSWWSRARNVWRGERLGREIDEELQGHLAEALEHGRDSGEARRAFGAALRHRERSRDIRLLPWLDSLRADAIFGWRQLKKRKAASAAAILSLGLAIGSCAAAFRLIDALLWRPLPVAHADRLYLVGRYGVDPGGNLRLGESSEYPLFERMQAAVRGDADLIAISYADRIDLTYGSDEEMEKVARHYVSGSMFGLFGLRPAAGRLLTPDDDRTPGAHPVAVISYDYWSRRFGRDLRALGRTMRVGNSVYQIVGVAPRGFTGAEPGTFVDVFMPAMMHPGVTRSDWSWFRTLAAFRPGVEPERVRSKLAPVLRGFQEERVKSWSAQTKQFIDRQLNQQLTLVSAASGVSGLQTTYRQALLVLGGLVALVLLIVCANLANLMTAQAAARAREMALRVSIGAGRGRLVQLVLAESVWVAALATAAGAAFAAWAAPFVLERISRPGAPVRLDLPADWRVLAFTAVAALAATCLFSLAPALRAASVRPAATLKGGDETRRRPRLMRALIAAQVAFCFLVHFAASLFLASFDRLANRPTGFSAERLLLLDTVARNGQPPEIWQQAEDRLRNSPGVEAVAHSGWPLLDGNSWNGFIWINGQPTETLAFFLSVSPGWIDTMRIRQLAGRNLRLGDPYPGAAIVNEAFVKQVLGPGDPIGKWFEKETGNGRTRDRFQVVGVTADTVYQSLREATRPTVFVPVIPSRTTMTYAVRTSQADPLALASALRQEVARARPELRVSNVRTQEQVIYQQTIRERLLATLAIFFAAVALLLAGVGLYGVLDYSVSQRRREIGIRIAVGAPMRDIAGRVIAGALAMAGVGSIAGVGIGLALSKYVETLLYDVKSTDAGMWTVPGLTIGVATVLAALPAMIRAARIDPAAMLRSE